MRLAKQSQFIPLQNVVYLITLPFLVRKIFIFYINDVLLFKCPFLGPKGLYESFRQNHPVLFQTDVDSVRESGNGPLEPLSGKYLEEGTVQFTKMCSGESASTLFKSVIYTTM